MKVKSKQFPFDSLSESHKKQILTYWGGIPVTPETIRPFYNYHGLSMLPAFPHRPAIRRIAQEISPSFNSVDYDDAKRAIQRGALLYAGVLKIASTLVEVPYSSRVIGGFEDVTPYSFAWDAYETLISEVPSFCSLLDYAKQGLETSNDTTLHALVLMGAGLVHLCTTDILEEQGVQEEITDLEAIFNLPTTE